MLLVILSSINLTGSSQVLDSPAHPVSKAEYFKKSRNQKTLGWVFFGVGAALDIAGIATTISKAGAEWDHTVNNKPAVNHDPEYALYITGTVSLLTSLGLFISAKANKKKGKSLSVDVQPYRQFKAGNIYSANYPALTLKIPL